MVGCGRDSDDDRPRADGGRAAPRPAGGGFGAGARDGGLSRSTIDAVDVFYLSMPAVLDIGDGSQDALLVRVRAGDDVGWGECEASPLTSIASLVCPMSHSACKPVLDSVLSQPLNDVADIARICDLVRRQSLDLLQ